MRSFLIAGRGELEGTLGLAFLNAITVKGIILISLTKKLG